MLCRISHMTIKCTMFELHAMLSRMPGSIWFLRVVCVVCWSRWKIIIVDVHIDLNSDIVDAYGKKHKCQSDPIHFSLLVSISNAGVRSIRSQNFQLDAKSTCWMREFQSTRCMRVVSIALVCHIFYTKKKRARALWFTLHITNELNWKNG